MLDLGATWFPSSQHSMIYHLGKQLASVNKPLSFGLFGEEAKPYLYCEDVSKSDNVELYDGDGTKQEDCLLVAAIGGKAGSAPFAILGVEAPADPGLSQEQACCTWAARHGGMYCSQECAEVAEPADELHVTCDGRRSAG